MTEAADRKTPHSIFVIGGSGAIGRDLLALLAPDAASGSIRLRAAARSDNSSEAVRSLGAEPVAFDLDDRLTHPERHVEALRGSDVVFLLTGYTVDMLAQSKAVIDAACEAGVRHIVHLGLMALPDTRGIHQGWHQMIEAYIERTPLGWTHLHPNMFMTAFYVMQLQNGVFPVPASGRITLKGYIEPQVKCSWIALPDIARAAATVLRDPDAHRARGYELAVESLSFADLAALASEHFGRDFIYEAVPVELLRQSIENSPIEQKYGESGWHTMRMVNEGLLPEFGDVSDDFERLTGRAPIRWRDAMHCHPEWFGLA